MGETFLEFRLQQLQVRNAQYQQKIAEKNQELLQLKLTSEKTVRVLNFYKVSEPLSTSIFPFLFLRVTQELMNSSCILPFLSQRDTSLLSHCLSSSVGRFARHAKSSDALIHLWLQPDDGVRDLQRGYFMPQGKMPVGKSFGAVLHRKIHFLRNL